MKIKAEIKQQFQELPGVIQEQLLSQFHFLGRKLF